MSEDLGGVGLFLKPFACGICNDRFSSSATLEQHINSHFENKLTNTQSEKRSSLKSSSKRKGEPQDDTSNSKNGSKLKEISKTKIVEVPTHNMPGRQKRRVQKPRRFSEYVTDKKLSTLPIAGDKMHVLEEKLLTGDETEVGLQDNDDMNIGSNVIIQIQSETETVIADQTLLQNNDAESDDPTEVQVTHDATDTFIDISSDLTAGKKNKVQVFVVDEYYTLIKKPEKEIVEGEQHTPFVDGVYKCKTCDQEIQASDAIVHLAATHSINPFKSLEPMEGVDNEYSVDIASVQPNLEADKELLQSSERKKTSKLHPCPYCNKGFYKFHLARHVDGVHLKRKIHPCPYKDCDKKFVTLNEAKYHFDRIHAKTHATSCPLCNKVFSCEKYMKNHMVTYHEDFTCDVCGKTGFNNRPAYKAHLSSHRVVYKEVKCEKCGTMCYSTQSLRRHKKEFPNCEAKCLTQCNQCEYQAKTPSRLKLHKQQVHSEERPYECHYEDCTSAFKVKYNLKLHIHKCHTGERKVSCEVCGRMFFYKAQLRAHMETHKTEKTLFCTVCGKGFVTKPQLGVHMHGVHSNTLFTCSECKFTTSHKSSMRRHLQSIHNTKDMVYVNHEETCPQEIVEEMVVNDMSLLQQPDASQSGISNAGNNSITESNQQYALVENNDNNVGMLATIDQVELVTTQDQVTAEEQEAMLAAVAMLQESDNRPQYNQTS